MRIARDLPADGTYSFEFCLDETNLAIQLLTSDHHAHLAAIGPDRSDSRVEATEQALHEHEVPTLRSKSGPFPPPNAVPAS